MLALVGWQGVARADPLGQVVEAMERGDRQTAFGIAEPMAENGNAEAAFALGSLYERVSRGSTDDRRAMLWYRRAAAGGSSNAIVAIGLMYGSGRGVEKDLVTEVKWLTLAADKSDFTAQFDLGMIFSDDSSGMKDYPRAYVMFTLANDHGREHRIPRGWGPLDFRAELARKMTPEQIAEAERRLAGVRRGSTTTDTR